MNRWILRFYLEPHFSWLKFGKKNLHKIQSLREGKLKFVHTYIVNPKINQKVTLQNEKSSLSGANSLRMAYFLGDLRLQYVKQGFLGWEYFFFATAQIFLAAVSTYFAAQACHPVWVFFHLVLARTYFAVEWMDLAWQQKFHARNFSSLHDHEWTLHKLLGLRICKNWRCGTS